MGAQLGTKAAISEINMTPLIDIVLVVLIIMMVNIPIQIEEMGVKLPSVIDNPPPPEDPPPEQLVLALYDDGTIALNRTLMSEDKLIYEVTRRLRPMEKKRVFVDAGATVPYGQVVDAMDLAREAGAATVALARLKESGPLAATSVAPGAMPRGVTFGSPRVVGSISEKKADDAIKVLVPVANDCYNKRLAAKPGLSGRFIVKVAVGPQGEIMSHEIFSSTVEDDELAACVDAKVDGVKFEPLGEQLTALIHYPLLFSPG